MKKRRIRASAVIGLLFCGLMIALIVLWAVGNPYVTTVVFYKYAVLLLLGGSLIFTMARECENATSPGTQWSNSTDNMPPRGAIPAADAPTNVKEEK